MSDTRGPYSNAVTGAPPPDGPTPEAIASDLTAMLVGLPSHNLRFARVALSALGYRCTNVETVSGALLALHSDTPDVTVIDHGASTKLLGELNAHVIPRLAADEVAVVWIGRGGDDGATGMSGLRAVVIDTPFTAGDLAEALAAAQWVSGEHRPRIGASMRRTAPLDAIGLVSDATRTSMCPLPGESPRPRRGSGSARLDALMARAGGKTREPADTPPLPGGFVPPRPATTRSRRIRASPRYDRHGDLQPGVVVDGRYEIVRGIGHGGMARVYRALDHELDDLVALKLLRTDSGDRAAGQRFRREMRLCRRLMHPNIVRTYEFGSWHDRLYYTMELMAGPDLGTLLGTRGPHLSMSRSLALMCQACEGLSAAHARGVVHRDIKPHNMFVVDGGRLLKLGDFGSAKGESEQTPTITHSGHVVGTPAYLPPERLRDEAEAGPQTDLYSLGASLYHVFTGSLPFTARDLSSLLTAIVMTEPPAPRKLNPMLPPSLERTIQRAMAKNPAQRHSDCEELRRDLLAVHAEIGDV